MQVKKQCLIVLNHQSLTMKPFWDCKAEEIGCINLRRLLDQLMSPESSHRFFRHVNFEGRNVGASMVMGRGALDESPDGESCRINIYINNNIQGVNNSALVGSMVQMGDPGVYLTFRGVKFNEDSRETSRKNRESNEKGLVAEVGFFGKFLVLIAFLLFCFYYVSCSLGFLSLQKREQIQKLGRSLQHSRVVTH